MRVISGSAGGLRLKTPDARMRPTMDKVKAAIFSSLGQAVPGASVLDLYAGSGAYGIESLSRGAARATFVEADRRAVETIRVNLQHTRLQGEVTRGEVLPWLEQARKLGKTFDLVFADPPYDLGAPPDEGRENGLRVLLQTVAESGVLGTEGLLILEQAQEQPVLELDALTLQRAKRYGKARVCLYRPGKSAFD